MNKINKINPLVILPLNYFFGTIMNSFEYAFYTPINSTHYSVHKYTLYFISKNKIMLSFKEMTEEESSNIEY